MTGVPGAKMIFPMAASLTRAATLNRVALLLALAGAEQGRA